MDTQLLRLLLRKSESETLDFEAGQYLFASAADADRGELLKDVIAMANAWKNSSAYIIIGVNEVAGRATTICGVTTHLSDHSVQQFINSKTNNPVSFRIMSVPWESVQLDIIEIDEPQNRPIWLRKRFGGLSAQTVYLRRGSSTDTADPDEIAQMGEMRVRGEIRPLPVFEIEFANPTQRSRLGTAATISCTLLTDPPPVKRSPAPDAHGRAIGGTWSGLAQPILPVMGELTIVPADEPTEEELVEFAKKNARCVPVSFWLKNSGTVNARNIRVELRIAPAAGIEILSGYDRPERPRASHEAILMMGAPKIELDVQDDHGERLIVFERGTLQPKAEHWVSGHFGVSAEREGECRVNVHIFADDLPDPQQLKLTLHVVVLSRMLATADLNE